MYTDCVCILYIDRRTRHCEWNDECGYGKAFLLHHFVIDVNKNKMICNATCTYISSQNGFMALGNRHFSKHFISTRVQRTHIFNQIHIYNLCANTYPWNLLHIRNSENTLWHFVQFNTCIEMRYIHTTCIFIYILFCGMRYTKSFQFDCFYVQRNHWRVCAHLLWWSLLLSRLHETTNFYNVWKITPAFFSIPLNIHTLCIRQRRTTMKRVYLVEFISSTQIPQVFISISISKMDGIESTETDCFCPQMWWNCSWNFHVYICNNLSLFNWCCVRNL